MENTENIEAAPPGGDPNKKKRDKVRSAWISFAGRIVAQIVGAVATVALGVMVLHRYTSAEARPGPPASASQPAPSAVQVIILTPAMPGLGAGAPVAPADRPCSPHLDGPPTSAAHLDGSTSLSR